MKSLGEAMAICGTLNGSLQQSLPSLEIVRSGLSPF